MPTTITTPKGSPRASCLENFLRRRRLASQYSINLDSSCVSIGTAKVKYWVIPIAFQVQIIYIVHLNSNTVKLANLLAQYLYTNKRLDLPGIGTFLLDPSINLDNEKNKDNVDAKYHAFLATPAVKTPWKKPVIALLILAGIGLAIWGGYTISTNKASEEIVPENNNESTVAVPDTTANKLTGDTMKLST